MGVIEKTFEVSLPSTEFESQAVLLFVPNDYKETIALQTSFSALSAK